MAGFTRSVALRTPNGERREYLKPIMFTAGIGAGGGVEAGRSLSRSPLWLPRRVPRH